MAQIIWTEPALSDLDGIAEYIALDNSQAANNLVKNIFSKVDRLKAFPQSGKRPPELRRNTRYREIIAVPCRIFYRVEKNKAYIVYIMRSERMLHKYILSELENGS